MFNLPRELQQLIYEYDTTYREKYKECMEEFGFNKLQKQDDDFANVCLVKIMISPTNR